MLVTTAQRRRLITPGLLLYVKSSDIEQVKFSPYPGISMDQNLNFNDQKNK